MEVDLRDYLYVCYSKNLHERLKANNIKYFITGWNDKTSRRFWIYAKEPKTNKVITDFSNGVGKEN